MPYRGATVRGTYVTGLTDGDIWRLDIFEGSKYRRDKVKARILTQAGDEAGQGNVEGEEVEAETYIWCSDLLGLDEREWDFAEFQREKMRFWVGSEGEGEYAGRPSIIEVDEAVATAESDGTGGRGVNGDITNALKEQQEKDEALKNAV
ncbi:hypothetical protein LTR37_007570 [Vermiconidia calcicola]|uniref:Uncharacterized protein n=1 Tax=Vermiconidia calcicola TaxID=1690605 RepID=A0ACC3NED8_9PEZI|nr:hypothetical protein LTR37_007570 [Vermiconidia calcicola]